MHRIPTVVADASPRSPRRRSPARRSLRPRRSAQFPVYGKDKWLGSVNEFTRPLFTQYFNQVTPENARQVGRAPPARRAPRRCAGASLDTAYNFAQANGFPFNFHVLLWGNQQPTWMAALPAEEQLAEIKKWFAARRRALPEHRVAAGRQRAAARPARLHAARNQGNNCNVQRQLRAGARRRQRDRRHGLGLDPQRLPAGEAVLPEHEADAQRLQHHQLRHAAPDEYLQIINILKRENLIDVVGVQGHAFSTTGNMAQHKANLDRLAATGVPIQVTELDIDGVAVRRRAGRRGAVALLPPRSFPPSGSIPAVEGITLWGWRQPNHWRNAQNAPIVLSNDTPKPAALWLYNYVRGIAPVIRPDQTLSRRRRQRRPRRHGAGRRLGLADRPPEPAHVHLAHHRRQRRRHLRHRTRARASSASPIRSCSISSRRTR